jgi:hypothetical protein
MKVGVKFCGGCNPYINRKNVIDRVKELLVPDKYMFEYFNFDGCKMFLVINGCSLNCAKFEKAANVITVAGFKVDGKLCTENELPIEVVKRFLAKVSDPNEFNS